jgi:hypothetical protein
MHACGSPSTHSSTVTWQMPMPQVTVPKPSSVIVSQSLSTASHSSSPGTTSPAQSPQVPEVSHVCWPATQAPTSSVPSGPE